MRIVPSLLALVLTASATLPAAAQEYDPASHAAGWTRADADGSFTVYDPAGKRLVIWLRDGTTMGHVDLTKLDGTPESWVIDSYGNAWVVVGASLVQVDKKGKIGNRVKLPAAVADLAWEPRGLVIAYRTTEPFVEKREYKNGNVLWSWGGRSGASTASSVLYRVAITNGNEVVVTRGASLSVDILDLQSGKQLRQLALVHKGVAAPDLELGSSERGSLTWWTGKGVALAAVPGSQAPYAKMNGLLLARLDLNAQILDFLPTGLTEDHTLVGVVENEAAFLKPKGGFVFVPVR